MYVDPSKTIAAPYSQGNELVFGQNAGQQCVAMSLCSLIYNSKQGISSANDLIQIMNIGNQLYSSLSQLARQSYLMQTELPTMLNVLDTDYQLEYSESYTGTVGQETAIEGYQYCTSLQIAFESLLSQNHTNFILTVGCVGVSIYCNVDVGFKIFHSHARDVYGRAHPQGTCVLLEALSLDSLVCYFQSLHNNDMFEVKGVHVNAIQNSVVLPQDCAHETVNFNLSCVVAIYSLCYSIMKSCSYWNSNTLATIVDNSNRVRDNLCLNGSISASNLPKTVDVCGAEVSFNVLSDNKEGLLCDSVQSKSILEDAIINNNECTGFLMGLPCYCISCIYKPTKKSKYTYSLLVYNENHIQTKQWTLQKTRPVKQKVKQYRTMDATKKQKLLEKSKEIYTSHNSKKTVDSCVEQFKKKILEGPYHICRLYVKRTNLNNFILILCIGYLFPRKNFTCIWYNR